MKTSRSNGYFRENNFRSGVHKVKTPNEVRAVTSKMIGKHLITNDTPLEGLICRSVLLLEEVHMVGRYFTGMMLDRTHS